MMSRPRLLIIDDEDGILDMMRAHFALRGFEVFTAPDGGEGIRLCEAVDPDVILVDLKMKQVDGDRAVPELRRLAPSAKIFVISAYQDDIIRRRMDGLGMDAYFEKPVSILKIEEKVREAVEEIVREIIFRP